MSYFDRLPDELVEQIFLSLHYLPPLTENNHVRISSSSLYYDYSIQQPLLKQTYVDLLSMSLVCRRFHKILKSSAFWLRKCLYDYVFLPTQNFPADFTAYEKLYINNPFHPSYNLIEESKWRKAYNTRSRLEPIPCGSDRLYDEFNRLSVCRVTSYTWANFFQRNIPILSNKLSWNDLACLHPIIEFSVCVAPRWDCASECQIQLTFSDGHSWKCQRNFPQWNDSKWHRLTYHYSQYSDFPTAVTVHLAGKDSQFWEGFYGVKFAQTRLQLLFNRNGNETNDETEAVIEPRPDIELTQDAESAVMADDVLNDDLVEENSPEFYSSDIEANDDDY